MTQIRIALCLYLILAYLKYLSKIGASLQHMIRLLQLNLFARRGLLALLHGDPSQAQPPDPQDSVGIRIMGQWVRPPFLIIRSELNLIRFR